MIIFASNAKIQTQSWRALIITGIFSFVIYCFLKAFSINSQGIWQFVNLIAFTFVTLSTVFSIFHKDNYKNGKTLFLTVTVLKLFIALYCWNHSYSIILLYLALSFLTSMLFPFVNRIFSKILPKHTTRMSTTKEPQNKQKPTEQDLILS